MKINMKCDKCGKREATTHITKVINGYKEEFYLCPECASKSNDYKEMKESMSFGIGDFLTGMFTGAAKQSEAADTCPTCHMSYSSFIKSGKLGCGDCYSAFSDRIARPLRQIHGNADHVGKIPRRGGDELILDKKISALEAELNQAVLRQDFETAASLRDEIIAIRTKKEA